MRQIPSDGLSSTDGPRVHSGPCCAVKAMRLGELPLEHLTHLLAYGVLHLLPMLRAQLVEHRQSVKKLTGKDTGRE